MLIFTHGDSKSLDKVNLFVRLGSRIRKRHLSIFILQQAKDAQILRELEALIM